MNIYKVYKALLEKCLKEFNDVVENGEVIFSEAFIPLKLRLNIIDGSIIDVFYSNSGKYSYHWERRIIDGKIYRHDNAPDGRWKSIKSFPKHFHIGLQDNVTESYLNDNPLIAIEEFLIFVKSKLAESL